MILSQLRDFLFLVVDGWITLYRRNRLPNNILLVIIVFHTFQSVWKFQFCPIWYNSALGLCVYIQGDSAGICETSRNDSMCDSKQKSSYKHVSDFRRLRSYGHFLIPVYALMWTAFALQTLFLPLDYCVWGWMKELVYSVKVATPQTSSEWVSGSCEQLARAVHNRAAACFAAGGGIFKNQL